MISVSRPTNRGFELYRRGSSAQAWSFALILLSQQQKKYIYGYESYDCTIAIADDNDLQLIEDVVCPPNTELIPLINQRRRTPLMPMQWRIFCIKYIFLYLMKITVRSVPLQGMKEGLNVTFDSRNAKAPATAGE